jgi:hypothetical protein
MGIKLVGAGLGRTGTLSLKAALEVLLGEPTYHMREVFSRPDHVAAWRQAAAGELPVWEEFFSDFGAVVDWPAAAFYAEIAEAFPDAPVLLSTRADPRIWWESASETIFAVLRDGPPPGMEAWYEMWRAVMDARFPVDVSDAGLAMAAYERHNEAVRATIDPYRLFEWQPGDGWEPLCNALDVAVPDQPFPHVNTRREFQDRQSPKPGGA